MSDPPLREVLHRVLSLPGAHYACITDSSSGELLAEAGRRMVEPGVVARCVASANDFLESSAGDELDDVMITSRNAYHVVRRLTPDGRSPVLLYAGLDRAQSNLAVARRELASSELVRILASRPVSPVRASPVAEEPPARARRPVTPVYQVPTSTSIGARAAETLLDGGRVPAPRRPPPVWRRPEPAVPAPQEAPLLPRRDDAARPAPALPPAAVAAQPAPEAPPVLRQRWADDVGTMRRLLAGLRGLR